MSASARAEMARLAKGVIPPARDSAQQKLAQLETHSRFAHTNGQLAALSACVDGIADHRIRYSPFAIRHGALCK
jgi:hypothetical protein